MRLIAYLGVVLLLTSCESQGEKAARAAAERQAAEQNRLTEETIRKVVAHDAKMAAEKKIAKRLAFEKMKINFAKENDQFENEITWRHKSYTKYFNTNGNGIVAKISGNRIFCYSAYVADDWIFHRSFIVKIGDSQRTFSGEERHEVVDGIAECVHLNSSDSKDLVRFVAESDPKQPVMMRFVGKYYKDITLSQRHRNAITETWHLYNSLQE